MPNYYAHFKFGDLVLARLDETTGQALFGQRPVFHLGCLGPDPLFFYRAAAPRNAPGAEARSIHRASALPVFQRLRDGGHTPAHQAYAAGFLCHYALDAACHGYVNCAASAGRRSHMALEAGFDRLLMSEDGFRTPRLAGFPPMPRDLGAFEAGAVAYQRTDGRALRAGCRAMRLDVRLLARLCGRGEAEVSLGLRARMEGAVPETAQRLTGFLNGEPLGPWYQRDFNGNGPAPNQCRQLKDPSSDAGRAGAGSD